MKVAIGTTIYPQALEFLEEFLDTLSKQTYQAFTLVMVIEGKMCFSEVEQASVNRFKRKLILTNEGASIVENRVRIIKESKKHGFDLLIFCDIDDLFQEDRFEKIVKAYEEDIAFFYNDIITFGGSKLTWKLPEKTSSIAMILQSNYIGLSNSAINLNKLSDGFIKGLSEYKGFVFDWYLYSRLLLDNHFGVKIDSITYYRIHPNNLVGDASNLNLEINAKVSLYSTLIKYDEIYTKLLKKLTMCEFNELIIGDVYLANKLGWWNLIYFDLEEL